MWLKRHSPILRQTGDHFLAYRFLFLFLGGGGGGGLGSIHVLYLDKSAFSTKVTALDVINVLTADSTICRYMYMEIN